MMDTIEILVCKWLIKRLTDGYGATCETSDLDDFKEMFKEPKDVFHSGRCASCRAKETIQWLEEHISLISNT